MQPGPTERGRGTVVAAADPLTAGRALQQGARSAPFRTLHRVRLGATEGRRLLATLPAARLLRKPRARPAAAKSPHRTRAQRRSMQPAALALPLWRPLLLLLLLLLSLLRKEEALLQKQLCRSLVMATLARRLNIPSAPPLTENALLPVTMRGTAMTLEGYRRVACDLDSASQSRAPRHKRVQLRALCLPRGWRLTPTPPPPSWPLLRRSTRVLGHPGQVPLQQTWAGLGVRGYGQ